MNMEICQAFGGDSVAGWQIFEDTKVSCFGGSF